MCAFNVSGSTVYDVERVACVIRTMETLTEQQELISSCFRKEGIL